MNETATNPFTGQSAAGGVIPVPAFLRDWGFRLQETMLSAAHAMKDADQGSLGILLTSLGIAILFGFVHIIGPGHGKLFTVGYFGSRRARVSEGLWLSALVNVLDSLSALILVGVAYGVLSLSLRAAGASADYVTKLIAYGAVTVLAAFHLVRHVRGGHDHSHHIPEKGMRPWVLALSVGLIPCPVSSAILAWGIVNGALGLALLLVAGVSLGGMMAMSVFSLVLIGGKKGIVSFMERRGFDRMLVILETGSLVFLAFVGIILFFSVL